MNKIDLMIIDGMNFRYLDTLLIEKQISKTEYENIKEMPRTLRNSIIDHLHSENMNKIFKK